MRALARWLARSLTILEVRLCSDYCGEHTDLFIDDNDIMQMIHVKVSLSAFRDGNVVTADEVHDLHGALWNVAWNYASAVRVAGGAVVSRNIRGASGRTNAGSIGVPAMASSAIRPATVPIANGS